MSLFRKRRGSSVKGEWEMWARVEISEETFEILFVGQ
jgi:hypothetical protein